MYAAQAGREPSLAGLALTCVPHALLGYDYCGNSRSGKWELLKNSGSRPVGVAMNAFVVVHRQIWNTAVVLHGKSPKYPSVTPTMEEVSVDFDNKRK